MNSARANATSGVKPKCIGRDSYLSQGRSIMRMQKHEPVTQHDHGGQCGCPTAPPGYLGDDACRGDKIHSRQHRDWRPGGILGGTGFPARAEYDSISEACTICSRVLVPPVHSPKQSSKGRFSRILIGKPAFFRPRAFKSASEKPEVVERIGNSIARSCLWSGRWCGSNADFRRRWAASRACRRTARGHRCLGWCSVSARDVADQRRHAVDGRLQTVNGWHVATVDHRAGGHRQLFGSAEHSLARAHMSWTNSGCTGHSLL